MATIRSSLARGRDEDAGEDRPRLVARRRAGHLARSSRRTPGPGPRRGRRPPARAAAGSPPGAACGCGRSPRPPTISTSCSAARSSSVTSSAGSARTTSTSSRAGRTTAPSRTTSPSSGDAQADLHVGGAQLDRSVLGAASCTPDERLHGAAGRGDAGDGLQLRRAARRARSRASSRCLAFTSTMIERRVPIQKSLRGVDGVHSSPRIPLLQRDGPCTWPVDEPAESVRRAGRHPVPPSCSVRRRTVS